jgi:hypothetical protein
VTAEFPWPESPDRVQQRVRGVVDSLLGPDELQELRLEWVTPAERPPGFSRSSAWIALRITVLAKEDESFRLEFWGPDMWQDWEESLGDLASNLEDWVCETSFAWGQERVATVPS